MVSLCSKYVYNIHINFNENKNNSAQLVKWLISCCFFMNLVTGNVNLVQKGRMHSVMMTLIVIDCVAPWGTSMYTMCRLAR